MSLWAGRVLGSPELTDAGKSLEISGDSEAQEGSDFTSMRECDVSLVFAATPPHRQCQP